MRREVQLLFLALFSILFFLTPYSEELTLQAALFLKADPLLALATLISSRQLSYGFLISTITLVSAILAGRVFCGYACPLGTLFDLAGRHSSIQKRYSLKNGKYYILIFLFFSAVFGLNLSGLVDPLALLTRMCTFILYPVIHMLGNAGLDSVRPAADYLRLLSLSHAQLAQPVFSWALLSITLCLLLFYLNTLSHRFWCRNLCPLGALLSLFSRNGLLRRNVSKTCTTCMKCYHACPMGAIPGRPDTTLEEECIVCLRCAKICPPKAVAFTFSRVPGAQILPRISATRRNLLLSASAGACAVFSRKISPPQKIASTRLMRPPGALPEALFLTACIRCGECMQVCPTNTLQPTLFEEGLDSIWSPKLVPRIAACDQTCSLCGTVCPTSAIRPLSLEEKKHARLGTAYIETNRCLVWAQSRDCFICDEQCPYNAIVFKWKDGLRRPFVIDTKCNGCGFCEQVCPVKGESAIMVTSHGELRLEEGSYIARAKELQLSFSEVPEEEKFFLEDGAIRKKDTVDKKLPEGFFVK